MDTTKATKVATLLIALISIVTLFISVDWDKVGIYAECRVVQRFIYPFFHASIYHAALNIWCLLSIVFLHKISALRLFMSYIIAATIPLETMSNLIDYLPAEPTVGLSGIIYVLFATLSFEVLRKWYYQGCMIFYIAIGFIIPGANAWIHLYCYAAGLIIAILNKPIKIN